MEITASCLHLRFLWVCVSPYRFFLTKIPNIPEVEAGPKNTNAPAGVDVLDIQRELQHAELEEAKAEMDWHLGAFGKKIQVELFHVFAPLEI